MLSVAHMSTSIILAGKHDSCYHSTLSFNGNVVVAETSYQHNSANFCGESKYSEGLNRGIYFFENTQKNFKSNLVLIVVLVLVSKVLYFPLA